MPSSIPIPNSHVTVVTSAYSVYNVVFIGVTSPARVTVALKGGESPIREASVTLPQHLSEYTPPGDAVADAFFEADALTSYLLARYSDLTITVTVETESMAVTKETKRMETRC